MRETEALAPAGARRDSSRAGAQTGRMTLRYETLAAECHAGEPHRAWLEEFLTPWFGVVDGGSKSDARVALDLDDEAFHRCRQAGPCPDGGSADVFSLDAGMQRMPRWSGTSEARVVFDEALGVFYAVDRETGKTRVRITSASGNRRARVALMRAVRELAMSEVRARGHALVHGAVVATGTGGALIAGPKRAGKTTLLVHALRAGGHFVSNDRAVLFAGPQGVVARGMPTIVRIRQATLDGLPGDLRAPLASGRLDHLATRNEIARGTLPPRPRPGRPRNLSPAQLCDWLSAPARREVPLARVLLLRTGPHPGVAVRELAPGAAAERLEACAFGRPGAASDLFPGPPPASSPAADPARTYRDLAKGVRCLELELGIGTAAPRIAEALASILS